MMDRKAQLSIFLVIALVIVAAVILVGFLFSQGKVLPLSQEQSTTILGSQVSPVKDLISSCVEDATTSGLQFVGARGGYASYTEQGLNSIDFAGAKVVVLARTEKGFVNRLPSKEEFERQISAYLNDEELGGAQIERCVDRFSLFEDDGYGVSPKKRTLNVNVGEESINVDVNWQVELSKGRARIPVEASDALVLADAARALRIATEIVNKEAGGVEFEGVEQDKYVTERFLTMRDFRLESQNYPTADQKIFWITSIPKDPQEKEFSFVFAVDRSVSL